MSSPAEIPHADEALKTLVARFKAEPGSSAFTELAAALLARGHASEALRIAEHGLQLVPDQVEGRVERAAALLALGRPRVAYVELRRALAIDPQNRRGMRLLGKAYVDSGAPTRAAALLAKRSMDPDYEQAPPPRRAPRKADGKAWKKKPAIDAEPTKPVALAKDGAIPDLFSALTRDLGLGAAVPEAPVRRVEVTQIIRRKGLLRPPRSASELAEITGPIVDTTQPGQLMDMGLEDAPQAVTTRAPAPLFSAASGQGLTPFALDDEPLFQEDMPFSVRPVETGASQDLEPTDDDEALDAATDRLAAHTDNAVTDSGDTLVDDLEEGTEPLETIEPANPPPALIPGGRAESEIRRFVAEKDPPKGKKQRFDGAGPVVEKSRANAQQRLQIVDPKPAAARVALAAIAAIAMLAYFIGLGWFLADDIAPWFNGSVAKESAPGSSSVPTKTARAK